MSINKTGGKKPCLFHNSLINEVLRYKFNSIMCRICMQKTTELMKEFKAMGLKEISWI